MKVSKRTRRVLAAVCAVTAAAALDVRLRTVTYTVVTDKVTAPVRLAVLADLHSCVYGPGQRTLLEAVAAAEPDGVLLAHIPVEWIRINPGVELTEEQKQKRAEAARRNFSQTSDNRCETV